MAQSEARTAAGTRLWVSAAQPATYTKAGFEALTWTEVGEVTEIPSFGKTYVIVNHNPLGNRQTIKRKGSYDNGEIYIPYAYDLTGDAGQELLFAALDSDESISVWVDVKDEKAFYFTAQVTSAPLTVGSADSIIMKNTTLAIDDDVLEEDSPP